MNCGRFTNFLPESKSVKLTTGPGMEASSARAKASSTSSTAYVQRLPKPSSLRWNVVVGLPARQSNEFTIYSSAQKQTTRFLGVTAPRSLHRGHSLIYSAKRRFAIFFKPSAIRCLFVFVAILRKGDPERCTLCLAQTACARTVF